ncbi:MAG: sensor histidine kinase [Anaerolineales bacterium]
MIENPIAVLLIEDNPRDARLISEYIRGATTNAIHLTRVSRLDEGLMRLREGTFDAVLLDLQLQDSHGLDTFNKLHGEAPHVPIVVLTGFDDQETALQTLSLGAQDYLVKGDVNGHLILRSVHYAIERQRSEEALKMHSERLEAMVQERTRELQEAHEDLIRKEKLATLGQLAGGIAHELRNPLGVIANAAYYLQSTLSDLGKTTNEYLELIAFEVAAAEKIINDLFCFSLRRTPVKKESSVGELVSVVIRKQTPPENISITTDLPDDLPKLFADRQHIEQVMSNLVTNAYQAMPEGGELLIEAHTEGGEVQIIIQDTGCGISDEHMEKLFEPLFTTKARGIGLGLAISRLLLEANQGRITVKSEVGKGSAFIIHLPTRSMTLSPGTAETTAIDESETEALTAGGFDGGLQ